MFSGWGPLFPRLPLPEFVSELKTYFDQVGAGLDCRTVAKSNRSEVLLRLGCASSVPSSICRIAPLPKAVSSTARLQGVSACGSVRKPFENPAARRRLSPTSMTNPARATSPNSGTTISERPPLGHHGWRTARSPALMAVNSLNLLGSQSETVPVAT